MRKILWSVVFFSLFVSVSLFNARSNSYSEEVAPRYRFTDLTVATGNNGNLVSADAINNKGEIAGHVFVGNDINLFLWSNGKTRILGKLPGSTSCEVSDINDKGEVVGTCSFPYGENGRGSFWPPSKYFLWKDGKMIDLSGTTSLSFANIKINNRSQVIMGALWEDGRSKSLGNWIPTEINDKGQIAGVRFTQTKKVDIQTEHGPSFGKMAWKPMWRTIAVR